MHRPAAAARYIELPAAHNGYVELYRNRDVAVFQYEPDKAADAVVGEPEIHALRLEQRRVLRSFFAQ